MYDKLVQTGVQVLQSSIPNSILYHKPNHNPTNFTTTQLVFYNLHTSPAQGPK